jgi:very-short-patch-repair endonuclease
VIGHRSIGGDMAIRHGLPVSGPATTFLELASLLSMPDLVAVGDHLVLEPRVLDPNDIRPHISLSELRDRCAAAGGRSVRKARAAAELVRVGAESRRETQLRLLALESGLPDPELGGALFDAAGHRIGYFDLMWRNVRLIAEYDGDQHRTSTSQYERDIRRFDEAVDAGFRIIRVRARGLSDGRQHTARRLRDAYAASTPVA